MEDQTKITAMCSRSITANLLLGSSSRIDRARCSERLRPPDCPALASIQCQSTSSGENALFCKRPRVLRNLRDRPEPKIYRSRPQSGAPRLATVEPPVRYSAGTPQPHSMRQSDRKPADPSAARKKQTARSGALLDESRPCRQVCDESAVPQ